MISVTIGTNTDRKKVTVNPNRTLKDVMSDNKVDYSRGNVYLDGESVKASDLNKTFEEFGIKEECMLVVAVKANAGC